MSERKAAIQTANDIGLTANSNFARIVHGLQDIAREEVEPDRQLIKDAILLLQQQDAEIRESYENERK